MFDYKYSYFDMPKYENYPKGMKLIKGNEKNIRATLAEDVVYANKDSIDLKIRFIYPDSMSQLKKYPLLVHIQGSAWMKQNLNNHILDFKEIVTKGYIVAIVEYRPCDVAFFPAQVEDAKTAMRYIQDHADELHIDINNIFLSGDSSGGHTSILCWATWKNNKLDDSKKPLCNVRGFINLYGISNLASIEQQMSAVEHGKLDSPDAKILGGFIPSENIQKAKEASGIYYIDDNSNNDPLLIMHGNKDRLVPFVQSIELFEKCKKYKKAAEFYCIDGADHGGSMFYCKETMDIIIKFLLKYTK